MKIIMFQGGLGNQLFEYVYYSFLKRRYPQEKIYGFYYNRWLKAHNGLEISKWFDVKLPPSTCFSHILSLFLFYLARVFYKLNITPNFINYKFERNDDALFQEGFWQDNLFMQEVGTPVFLSDFTVNDYNKELLKKIDDTESVSIHIRRGDYLSPKNQAIFGNICTEEYYSHCIAYIKNKYENPTFFVFSNDMEYAKRLFKEKDECVFVEGNKGASSFFDMYLMAHCKNMILANSTFSSWAAYLNKRANVIMSPSRWVNKGIVPNINLDDWVLVDISA